MSDSILVSIHAEDFLARLAGASDKLQRNLKRVVMRLSIEAQTRIKEKLSGPVLHNVTGTLRRSINRIVTSDASGVIATEGTNVKYAAAHEYGFDGPVSVRAYDRLAKGASSTARSLKRKIGATEVGKIDAGSVVHVRAHQRHMHVEERSFLRSTIREMAPQIRTDIKAAALEALR